MRPGTTEQLFLRFRRHGDTEALGEVFDRTAPELFKLALFLAPAASDAEDLLQETFLTAIRCVDGYDGARPLRPWLLGILGNHARRARRRKRPVPDVLPLRLIEATDPSVAAENAEIGAALGQAIEALPLPYRQVVALHLLHGLQAKEIADVLERPAGTVRSQIVRGLERLRRALPAGLALAAGALLTPGHALAGVRSDVLRAAQRPRVAPPLATGVLPVRALAALSALLALGVCAWLVLVRGDTDADARPLALVAATVGAARVEAPAGSGELQERTLRAPLAESIDGGRIELRVSFVDGRAAGGVGVQLMPWPGSRELVHVMQLDPARRVASTDASGLVAFAGLSEGRFIAQVLGGRQRATIDLAPRQHAQRVLELQHGCMVSGRTLDAAGRALPHCEVKLSPSAGRYEVGDLVATSDAEGRFWVISTERLAYAWAGASGHRASRVVPVTPATTDIELELGEPGVEVRGQVVDPRGRPLRGATVGLVQPSSLDLATTYARTDDNGAFVFREVAPGEVALVARCSGNGSAALLVDLEDTRHAVLQLTEPATLRGRVLGADGRALAFHSLFAEVAPQSWSMPDAFLRSMCARTDASGAYVLTDLPAGAVRVRVVSSDGQSWLAEGHFRLASGEQAEWDAQESMLPEIRGRVRDRSGVPLAGATVVATPSSGSAERLRRYRRKLATSDAGGEFVLERTERDVVYRLTAHTSATGELDEFSELGALDAVCAGAHGVEFVVQPQPADAAISGRLRDPVGLALFARRLPGSAVREVPLDAHGHFVLDALRAGTYRLGVGRADRGWQWLTAATLVDGARFDVGVLSAAPPAELRVVVRDGDGAALTAADVRLVDAERVADIVLRSDGGGIWVADGIAPGDYELQVVGSACVPQRRPVSLAPAVQHSMRIEAQRGIACRLRFPFEPLDNTYDGTGMLQVTVSDAHGHEVLECRTGQLVDGAFVLDTALPTGHYRVAATSVWGAHAATELVVKPGAPIVADALLVTGYRAR